MEYIIILSTINTETDAQRIAENLVKSKFAACVNIIPGIQSIYEWEGKQRSDGELLLLIKTTKEKEKDVYEFLIHTHPYDVPEIVTIPIQNGSDAYLNWMKNILNPKHETY